MSQPPTPSETSFPKTEPNVFVQSKLSLAEINNAETTEAFPEGGLRAWLVALGAAGVFFCTFGYSNAYGVFQNYYMMDQLSEYSASDIAWIGSVQGFLLFAAALVGGPLFDKYGGKVIWAPEMMLVLSVMLTSLCEKYYQFFLAQGVLGGIGMGMTMTPAMSATAQYFHKRRAAAMGVSVAGASIGGLTLPIILQNVFYSSLGFEWGVRIAGFLMLVALLFASVTVRARLPPRTSRLFKFEAFKQPRYVAAVTAMFILNLGILTPCFYLPAYATDHGISQTRAAYILALLNGCSLIGRIVPGILADRVGAMNMLSIMGVGSGLVTLAWTVMNSTAAIIVFAVLFGIFSGANMSLSSAAIANVTENPQDIGTYMGMAMGVMSIGALVGPPINGALLNADESYLFVQIFSGVVIVVGAVAVQIAKVASGKAFFARG